MSQLACKRHVLRSGHEMFSFLGRCSPIICADWSILLAHRMMHVMSDSFVHRFYWCSSNIQCDCTYEPMHGVGVSE